MAISAFEISGTVEHGDHRGRDLGFPTANIRLDADVDALDEGVYAAWCRLPDGSAARAAVSVGRRPTFYADEDVLVEAHILDFDGDLYDQTITLHLVDMIRGQVRFEGVPKLMRQLERDVDRCRRILACPGSPPTS